MRRRNHKRDCTYFLDSGEERWRRVVELAIDGRENFAAVNLPYIHKYYLQILVYSVFLVCSVSGL